MMKRWTCILCPNGCKLHVELDGKEILSLRGARCPRGQEFALQELHDPKRNIATSVLVKEGELPLVSVRLTAPISKNHIFDVMKIIKELECTAPVLPGQVILKNVLDLGVDIISTKKVRRV